MPLWFQSYIVEYVSDDDFPGVLRTEGSDEEITIYGLKLDTEYNFTVRALSDRGEGLNSPSQLYKTPPAGLLTSLGSDI